MREQTDNDAPHSGILPRPRRRPAPEQHGDARDGRAWLAGIVESSSDAVVGLDPAGTICSWNAGAERLYGHAAGDAIGRSVAILIPPDLAGERERGLGRVLAGAAEFVREESDDLRADGTRIAVALTRSPIRDAAGSVIGVARIAQDITERKSLERELRWGSEHDPLTGLFNRRRFAEELAREVTRAPRYPVNAGSLLLLDLDGLKYVNDTLGHRAGDEVIKGVAAVLAERVRSTDVLARVGGDEFAVLLPQTRLASAWLVARSLSDAVREQVTVADGRMVRTTLSVGVAPLGGGMSGEDSMSIADMAMYEAKRHGPDGVITFSEQPQNMRDQLAWAQRLQQALAEDHFALYEQPIVELETGAVDRHELLLALREPDGRVAPPNDYLAAAERFGLIHEIDRWVIRAAVELIAARGDGDRRGYTLNLSGPSIGERGVVALIGDELAGAGVDPGRLVIEVTEPAATVDLDLTRDFMDAVGELGVRSALDDFGSGLSSFACLRELPVDLVKIDGGLVRPQPGGERDLVLLKAIVDVAHAFGMRTVAEHVSSAAALASLRQTGVDFGQGDHLGRPRPALAAPAREAGARRRRVATP
jgi:diguanylate cyclase (GGDEF)-like protein/PAS domain S-box-containing protein